MAVDKLSSMANLLVGEDDETIGKLLADGLQAHGHQVTLVRARRSMMRTSSAHDFDLVLLDLGLRDLDGVEVCRQLRTTMPAAVVVVLTARDAEIDVVVGLDAGADHYLPTPCRYA